MQDIPARRKCFMSSTALCRASGLALLLGSPLLIIGIVSGELFFSGSDPHQYLTPLWIIVTLIGMLGAMLLLMGFFGLVPRVDRLGFAGIVLTFLGGFLLTMNLSIDLLVFPWLAQDAPRLLAAEPPALLIFTLVASVLFALGGIALGIASLRAGLLPRFAVVLLIIGVVLNLVATPLSELISTIMNVVAFVFFALPFGWIGYVLLSERHMEVAQADPASVLKSAG
jgi:hypothetical protein